MAITLLSKGSLSAASPSNVLTVTTGQVASLSNVVVCNASANAIDVTVSLLDAADVATKLVKFTLPATDGASKIVVEAIGGMPAGHKLRLEPSTATQIDFTVYGAISNA